MGDMKMGKKVLLQISIQSYRCKALQTFCYTWAAVAQWWSSNNLKVGGLIPTLTAQEIGGLTAGGVAVHLLVTVEVPLSKA